MNFKIQRDERWVNLEERSRYNKQIKKISRGDNALKSNHIYTVIIIQNLESHLRIEEQFKEQLHVKYYVIYMYLQF